MNLTLKRHALFAVACLISVIHAKAQQVQRIAILPQIITLKPSHDAVLKSLGIDYDRPMPSGQTTYKVTGRPGNIEISINGKPAKETFAQVLQSSSPLFFIVPQTGGGAKVELNRNNTGYKGIKTVSINVKQYAFIGTDANDNNISQATTVFESWGVGLTQPEYDKYAKTLDILLKNNLFISGQPLSAAAKTEAEKLYHTLDFDICDGSTFKVLVNNGFYALDQQGNITTQSSELLKQYLYYKQGIAATLVMNQSLERYANPDKYKQAGCFETDADLKAYYYGQSSKLTRLGADNKAIKDTQINGARYVLMVAWKSDSYKQFFSTGADGKLFYKSPPKFFQYPLFITSAFDIETKVKAGEFDGLTEAQCRGRMMQILGLPPTSTNSMFVEFWIKDNDIFRPTTDSSLSFSNAPYRLEQDYLNAFADFSAGSFSSSSILSQFPFTGCGYTYDYSPANASHRGASEFVLKEARTIYVRRMVGTMDYLNGLGRK